LRIKEQETHLTLHEHDDDDDDKNHIIHAVYKHKLQHRQQTCEHFGVNFNISMKGLT